LSFPFDAEVTNLELYFEKDLDSVCYFMKKFAFHVAHDDGNMNYLDRLQGNFLNYLVHSIRPLSEIG